MPDLQVVNDSLSEIFSRRLPSTVGGDPYNFVELLGGHVVDTIHYEPDPITYRGYYYYNTSTNVLYRKVVTTNLPDYGIIRAQWKPVSE